MRSAMLLVAVALIATAAVAPVAEAAFPGANGRIAFVSDRDGRNEVYVMNADGSGQTRLTTTGGDGPSFSADGALIAYRDNSTNGITVMNADGSGRRQVTDHPAGENIVDDEPAFAPSGAEIVFVSTRGGERDLYVVALDGSGIRRLTTNAAAETQPAFSPDGSRIVFADGAGIHTVDPNGGGRATLSSSSADSSPTFSPDGSLVAFNRVDSSGSYDIHVMKADGTGQRALTSTAQFSDAQPAFSPDGTQIVLVGVGDSEAGGTDAYVMNADGTGHRRLAATPGYEFSPDWQPAAGGPPQPPPPPPPPPADTAAPRIQEALVPLARVLTMNRRGFATARVACPAGEVSCRIFVSLFAPARDSAGARSASHRHVRIGRGRATVPGGSRANVRVKLTRSGVALVRRARRRGLRVRVDVSVVDQAGNRAAGRRLARVRAARGG